jgi:hypothetical protein
VGGAAEGGDVVLNVDTVSSFHAVFEQDRVTGNLFVTDLNRYADMTRRVRGGRGHVFWKLPFDTWQTRGKT